MIKLRKRRITFTQTRQPKMCVLLSQLLGEREGEERRGTLQQHNSAKNLPNAADTAQETRVCRPDNLRGIQCQCPDSPAVLSSHFRGIFCVRRPCQSHGGEACCAGRLKVIPSRLLQLGCSTGVERRAVISL